MSNMWRIRKVLCPTEAYPNQKGISRKKFVTNKIPIGGNAENVK